MFRPAASTTRVAAGSGLVSNGVSRRQLIRTRLSSTRGITELRATEGPMNEGHAECDQRGLYIQAAAENPRLP